MSRQMKGRPKSEEARRAMSAAKKGRPLSEANRLAISKALRGKKRRKSWGKAISKAKKGVFTVAMRAAALRRRGVVESRRVSVRERFWRFATKGTTKAACWGWTGATHDWGYGLLGGDRRGQVVRAHRVSWEIHNGPIPAGGFVLHHCDNPPCSNPKHLFLRRGK
jgi:hypothetical protein